MRQSNPTTLSTPTAFSRRQILESAMLAAGLCLLAGSSHAEPVAIPAIAPIDPALAKDWLAKWEKYILANARDRYCDRETGEELGWLVSPFLNGFHHGYLATDDTKWLDLLIDWGDAWIKRGVKEPDGFIGWPKADGASTGAVPASFTDNILGEAMALRPLVCLTSVLESRPQLRAKYGGKAKEYIELSERVFAKWEARACWRDTKEGGVWVVPTFGIDQKTGQWTQGYDRRKTDGFTLPPNKQNEVAQWLLAMDAAKPNPLARERAEKWWRTMKSRMRLRDEKYYVWNYWDPAGPWDYKPDGDTKHWVGVHPNGGYYAADLEGIVAAHTHGMVFDQTDINRLIATNRDFMWDQKILGAKFQRIDGGASDPRWKGSAGVLWTALVPFDATMRKIFEANHKPDSWGGLASTPRYCTVAKK